MLDLAVPLWAERKGATTWHPHHIAERYGLFTIIVLGEAVLASSLAIQALVNTRTFDGERAAIAVGAIVALFMMWWIYFDYDAPNILTGLRNAFVWGYGHVFLWGAIAAVGAGIGVCIDYASAHSELSRTQAHLAMAVPLAIFLVSLWSFHDFTEALHVPASHCGADRGAPGRRFGMASVCSHLDGLHSYCARDHSGTRA